MQLVRSDQAADRLRELLLESGIDIERPSHDDVERTWGVFHQFVLEPAEDVASEPGDYDDSVLAQYGVYDWAFTGASECSNST